MTETIEPEIRESSTPPSADEPEPELEASPEEVLRTERDQFRDKLLRTAADFENFRKRSKRDIDDAARRGKEQILREVLPVIDNLGRALEAAVAAEDPKGVVEGVSMVLRMFDDAGERMGLEPVPGVGERFDPALHDAVQQVESAEHRPGTVVQQIIAGYQLDGKLLHPAMVVVAKAQIGQVAEPAGVDDEDLDDGNTE